MLNVRSKLRWCIAGNATTLIILLGLVLGLDNDGKYARFGPNDDLVIISVKIDTYTKYTLVLLLIAMINCIQILSEDIGMPIVGFNVFNPDKKHIDEFSKLELQVYANTMFMIGAIRNVFLTMVTISQMDIAIFSVMIKELTSFYTIRMLLNEKTFGPVPTNDYAPVELDVV